MPTTDQPLSIAIIRPDCNVLPRAYYNSQELGLAIALANLGVNVDVYYAANVDNVRYEEVKELTAGSVTLVELPYKNIPLIGQGYYPDLINELKKRTYNLIQVNEYNDIINYRAIRYASKADIPVIIYQGMYKNLLGKVNQLYTLIHDNLLLPDIIKRVTKVYSKTSRASAFLENKGFKNRGVLPVGLDPKPFNKESVESKYSKESLGIPEQHTTVTYIGNFEPRRNIAFLLDLAKHLKDQPFSFVLVGAGELFEHAIKFKEENQLLNLHILDRIPQQELSQVYAFSDVFLLASDYEIYGMVLIEAMYHSVVPISNITAGSESLIENNIDGFLIDNLELTAWKEKLLHLHNNPTVLEKMKSSASNKISTTLTWDSVAKHYYQDIILQLGKNT